MRSKRVIAVILAVIMLVFSLPTAFAAENIVFSFSSSVPSGSEVAPGDTVTYTVSLDANSGFAFGTLYFAPSDNLTYLSSTYKGKEAIAEKALTGENEGAYGIIVAGKTVTGTDPSLCTVSFKVTGSGDISVRFYAYQLNDGNAFVSSTVNNGTVTHKGKELTPPVITTAVLPEAVMGYEYSFKISADYDEFLTFSYEGTLPSGLALYPDGTLRGTPTQFGSFKITVKATLLDELVSDPKELNLTVLEKPRALELESGSGYEIDGALLRNVAEKTTLSAFLANFKNSERVKIFDSNGNEVKSSSSLIGTGYTVSLMHGDEKVHTVTVVVLGDVSGNGRVDAMDYQRVKMCLFGTFKLDGAYYQAALVSGRTNITAMDYQRIKMHIFGTFNIYK